VTLLGPPRTAASDSNPSFERVVVETTGLADPAAGLLHAALRARRPKHHYELECIVTTVDRTRPSARGIIFRQAGRPTRSPYEDDPRSRRVLAADASRSSNPAARVLEASFGNVDRFLFAPAEHTRDRGFRPRRRHAGAAVTIVIRTIQATDGVRIWLTCLLLGARPDSSSSKGSSTSGALDRLLLNGVQHVRPSSVASRCLAVPRPPLAPRPPSVLAWSGHDLERSLAAFNAAAVPA